MRALVLCALLFCAQLTWATRSRRSGLLSTHKQRSHSGLSGDLSKRDQGDCKHFISSMWYASWHSDDLPLANVSWCEYTWAIYAFATTTSDNTIGLSQSDQTLLPQFVQTAKQNNVRPLLSLGGWSGSGYFSSAVATAANRTAFAQAVINTVSQYGLDGIEFDWEYPGYQGIGCNTMSANDTCNFLSFLQTLRSMSGPNLIISAAVTINTFVGSNGEPLTDVSEFAKVLDYIEIMGYDIWGRWSDSVGPFAPLCDSCAPNPKGSVTSAVNTWTKAGFSAKQIILGVSGTGQSYHVDSCTAYDASGNIQPYVPFNKTLQPAGDKWDSTASGVDQCGNPNVVGGVFDLWGLVDAGFLNADGTVANGISYLFDQCSQTSFVYNNETQVMVSYEDACSFTAKGKYIASEGLAGFSMWEAGADWQNLLIDAINTAVGNCQ